MKKVRVLAYEPGVAPEEYDPRYVTDELRAIANVLQNVSFDRLALTPLHVEPSKKYEGLVVYADGTDWNPGGTGAGVYVYSGTAWVKL